MAFSMEPISYQLKLLNRLSNIPLSIMTRDGQIEQSYPFQNCDISFQLSPSAVPGLLKSAQSEPFYDIDDNLAIFSLIPVDKSKDYYIFVGPAMLNRTVDAASYHCHSILFNELPFSSFEAIFSIFPLVNPFDFFSLLQLLYYNINKTKFTAEQFFDCNAVLKNIRTVDQILFIRREASVYHHTYLGELQVCDIIRNGQIDKLSEGTRFAGNGIPGTIHPDPLRNAKDLGIITITIIARPAIQGGVSDEVAYAMSDAYMQEIEACNSQKDVFNVCFRAASEYTHAVAELKKQSDYSEYVVLCIEYLQKHLHEKILLEDIADTLNVGLKQLTTTFKKETGESITTYILNERIREAKSLLTYTNIYFSEISTYLNFCSQSYFTSVFKKNTGMTPAEYRKKYYKMPVIDKPSSIADYISHINQLKSPLYDLPAQKR